MSFSVKKFITVLRLVAFMVIACFLFGVAEVFDYIPGDLSIGDSVYVNSKERVIRYYYIKERREITSRLKMVGSGTDADFVRENSKLIDK